MTTELEQIAERIQDACQSGASQSDIIQLLVDSRALLIADMLGMKVEPAGYKAQVTRLEAEKLELRQQVTNAKAVEGELRDVIASLQASIGELEHDRDLNVQLSEALKQALRMPGNGNYVEFAKECRDALDKLTQARTQGIAEGRLMEQFQQHVGGKVNWAAIEAQPYCATACEWKAFLRQNLPLAIGTPDTKTEPSAEK